MGGYEIYFSNCFIFFGNFFFLSCFVYKKQISLWVKTHKDEEAYAIMGIIKNQLDPHGIMNPGKVLF